MIHTVLIVPKNLRVSTIFSLVPRNLAGREVDPPRAFCDAGAPRGGGSGGAAGVGTKGESSGGRGRGGGEGKEEYEETSAECWPEELSGTEVHCPTGSLLLPQLSRGMLGREGGAGVRGAGRGGSGVRGAGRRGAGVRRAGRGELGYVGQGWGEL